MAVSYEDAMATLGAMFEGFDRETISCVLDVNQGQLEKTIDTLLRMQADDTTAMEQQAPVPAPVAATRGRRVQLPDDFLRVPKHTLVSEQEEKDRIMAAMLQNEYFRQELLADGEFSEYLGGLPPMDARWHGVDAARSYERRASTEKSAMEVANETLSAVSGKLSTMSEAMRNKMYSMYTRFQSRNDSAAHRDPDSRRRLMSMSDEEDEADGRRQAVDEHETLHRRKTQPHEAASSEAARAPSDSLSHSKAD
ncbi:hypothetical protein ACHHYP_08170 [Achlya hypogyna]|uniref:Uncharacterized protein n=1 Tax=Achlya hypogyna TaxID=1202772 RepID=A0A1V9YPJ5_ACHHY|nr:hypothetical protein ACHHYP_08170 [Achlya hypogyna]